MNRILFDHNRIDILVNNSGYQFDRNIWYKKFHEGTIEELQKIIEVDLKGSVSLSRAVIPIMIHNANTDCEKENEGESSSTFLQHLQLQDIRRDPHITSQKLQT